MPKPLPTAAPDLPTLPDLPLDSLSAFLETAAQWVDLSLPRYLPQGEPRAELYDLARDYPERGGKRFRPALMLLCAGLVGAEPRQAVPSAVALELFQNFALVHDDIEDGSLVRRGKPALHRLHGVPLALNAGDLLFGLVYEALAHNEALLGAEQAFRVQGQFAEVFRRTFEGQAMDIGFIHRDHFPDRAEFEAMILRKTGWYSGRGPCQLGALIGGGDPVVRDALGAFGERLGIGFQLRDDLLNLTTDSAELAPGGLAGGYGKERGGDLAEGKRTLIVIELLERVPPVDADRVRAILRKAPGDTQEAEVEWVIALAEGCGALDAVRAHAATLGEQAREALQVLPAGPHRGLLEEMTRWLVLERQG